MFLLMQALAAPRLVPALPMVGNASSRIAFDFSRDSRTARRIDLRSDRSGRQFASEIARDVGRYRTHSERMQLAAPSDSRSRHGNLQRMARSCNTHADVRKSVRT